jgi:tetratricopeptide (TPR) repeat protein
MDTPCEQEINPEFIQSVLALPTMAEQAAFLSGVHLLNEAGLSNLMDYAAGLVGRDPGQARKLAQLCADKVPKIVARALYIQAQTYAINGEFDVARAMIEPDSTLPSSEATMLAALAYQNLGVCHRRVGHYEEAIYAYAMAEARYRKLNMPAPIGHLSINRGLVLINLGQARVRP